MGVSFYTCEECGHNFPDCGDYFRCYSCNSKFCSDECGGREVEDEEQEETEDDWEEITTCIFCRMESATDTDLLNFLLKTYNLTRNQVFELYKKENEAV